MERREEALLRARVEELDARAQRGDFCFTRYLTPHELAVALAVPGGAARFAWGGWNEAERQRLFFVPDYAGEPEGSTPEAWLRLIEPMFGDALHDAVTRVRVDGSGYRTLAHRDYLGSILALGVERSALGDIVLIDAFSAAVFCDAKLADYFWRRS